MANTPSWFAHAHTLAERYELGTRAESVLSTALLELEDSEVLILRLAETITGRVGLTVDALAAGKPTGKANEIHSAGPEYDRAIHDRAVCTEALTRLAYLFGIEADELFGRTAVFSQDGSSA